MEALNLSWRKSSFSGNGGDCVEVGQAHDGTIVVRDTKEHGRDPVQQFTRAGWKAFTASVQAGEFDLGESSRLSLYARLGNLIFVRALSREPSSTASWNGGPPGSTVLRVLGGREALAQ
jgi:hypothetical protein